MRRAARCCAHLACAHVGVFTFYSTLQAILPLWKLVAPKGFALSFGGASGGPTRRAHRVQLCVALRAARKPPILGEKEQPE